MTTQELKEYIDRVLGNNIRCLLPSYWWKRLFGLVVDKFDDVEKSAAAMVKAAKMPIVDTEKDLDKLNVEIGSLASVLKASVKKISECYYSVGDDNFDNFTRITNISIKATELSIGVDEKFTFNLSNRDGNQNCLIGITGETGKISVMAYWTDSEGNTETYLLMLNNQPYSFGITPLNRCLAQEDMRYKGTLMNTDLSSGRKVMVDSVLSFGESTETFVKGEQTWERFVKESEIDKQQGSSVPTLYITQDGDSYYNDNIACNQQTFTKLFSDFLANRRVSTITISGLNFSGYDDYCTVTELEFGSLDTIDITIIKGNEQQSYRLYKDGRLELIKTSTIGGESGITTETDPIFSASPAAGIKSTDITNWNNKVDKVSGKQLSTEDFTTALKNKLNGLSNYDDTQLENAINTLRSDFDKLVSGDTTTAIKTFNEVIAFLNGISDSESLDNIIASIEQQIANKQDKLVSGTNIKTINGESIVGEGDIIVGADTSTLATKEELLALQNSVIENEEVTALAISEVSQIERKYNSGIYYTKQDIDKKIDDIVSEVINNEEVTALAYNELKELINGVQTQNRYLQAQIDSLKNA